jgi:hypothetical protein
MIFSCKLLFRIGICSTEMLKDKGSIINDQIQKQRKKKERKNRKENLNYRHASYLSFIVHKTTIYSLEV